MLITPVVLVALSAPPVVIVDRDNVEINESCTVLITKTPIADTDGNGVVHIRGDDLTVVMHPDASLRGDHEDTRHDAYTGTGIRLEGSNITLVDARVSGFKVAIHASDCPGLTVDAADVSDNYRQHLLSTPQAEVGSDWLWPHRNDENEWATNYGAGLYIEDAAGVTVRNTRAREVQNGIVLDRVDRSQVYDNDCSFLSGWGLAMWRSNGNVVARNAFDFCIRGYSHGVYNRGQDSAGILIFEQCSNNIIAENSVTHGGDGVFGFAGREAIGEEARGHPVEWHERRGCTDNLLIGNDFSYAAAHGIEMTFSTRNRFFDNRIVGNAISGIWAGYCSQTEIARNTLTANGIASDQGAILIEHGSGNRIVANSFDHNRCGIRLWWDEDAGLMKLPWAQANETDSTSNLIVANTFDHDETAIRLVQTMGTRMADNTFANVGTTLDADAESQRTITAPLRRGDPSQFVRAVELDALPGVTTPVGARRHLRGREHIIMTEWGPWDHESPLLRLTAASPGDPDHRYELYADAPIDHFRIIRPTPGPTGQMADIRMEWGEFRDGRTGITISAPQRPGIVPYEIMFRAGDFEAIARGVHITTVWTITVFPSEVDPRQDLEQWRRQAEGPNALTARRPMLELPYGGRGPSEMGLSEAIRDAALPHDHFGTIATTTIPVPAGRWRIVTQSDDGLRVSMNDTIVIDDWTHHAPRTHTHEFEVAETTSVTLHVEHFELDGHAVLTVKIEPVD